MFFKFYQVLVVSKKWNIFLKLVKNLIFPYEKAGFYAEQVVIISVLKIWCHAKFFYSLSNWLKIKH